PGDRLTATKTAVHSIPTPSFMPGREITLKIREFLNIITPSKSPWNFPILVILNKVDASGVRKWRICIDFRKLNEIIVGDCYPSPNIQDILDKLGKARYFSALDCASGY
ncbi:hypothetical protein B7P43_G12112, partial [Cryptotermes secundus]